jgi:hypothetical protein
VTTQDVATKAVLFFKVLYKCREWIGEHTRWVEGKRESTLAYGQSTIESRPGETPVGLDWELNLRVRAHDGAATNEQSTGAVNVRILIRSVPQR